MKELKAGMTVLATIPELKIQLCRATIRGVFNLPGKQIAFEIPEPVSNHDCDGLCKPRQGYWGLLANIVPARDEAEAKKMMEEAAKQEAASKPKQMVMKIDGDKITMHEAATA